MRQRCSARSFTLAGLVASAMLACGTSGAPAGSLGGSPSSADAGLPIHPDGAATTDGETTGPTDLSALLEPVRAKYSLPALAAVVISAGSVAGRGAVGVRELGLPTPVTGDDLFHLGGTVQTITATLAATVVEDGRITWTTTLGGQLPDVPMHASYKDVTLEDLLAQRGGVPATIPAGILANAYPPGDPAALRDQAVRALLAAGPATAPGTFVESDASFLLAAAMVERATSVPWETLTETRIFAPLGMTSCTTVLRDLGAEPLVPWGHVISADVTTPIRPGSLGEPPPALAPALGLRCSLGDWASFAALHLAGARGATTTVLRPPSFGELQTPIDATHARGWYAVSRAWAGAALALNYTSRDPAEHAVAWLLPSKNVALLVATNQGGKAAENAADEIVLALVGAFAGAN